MFFFLLQRKMEERLARTRRMPTFSLPQTTKHLMSRSISLFLCCPVISLFTLTFFLLGQNRCRQQGSCTSVLFPRTHLPVHFRQPVGDQEGSFPADPSRGRGEIPQRIFFFFPLQLSFFVELVWLTLLSPHPHPRDVSCWSCSHGCETPGSSRAAKWKGGG